MPNSPKGLHQQKYYEKEVAENQQFFDFVQEYLKNPSSFRLKSTQVPLIKKYLNKNVVNKKTQRPED